MLRLPLILSFILLAGNAQAFVPVSHSAVRHKLHLNSIEPAGNSAIDDFLEDIKMRLRIAQESNASGVSKKQTLAAVIAGEYDSEAVEAKIDEAIASAPCVMFTWESSPSCKKAVEAFETLNANVKIVRLDDPWSEGNPMRAALGKRVGRTSVPFVFIKGNYIGGFDGGIDDDACGMVDMAFKGTLRSKLGEAGAMKD